MDGPEFEVTLVRRLDILISLMLDVGAGGPTVPISAKILRLLNLGLTPAEVAEIVGRSPNYVTAVIHTEKHKAKRKDVRNDQRNKRNN